MKKILVLIIKHLAKAVISRHRPYIIAITGSYGKTTTKDILYSVLKTKLNVWKSYGNFNTEWGLPLSVINEKKFPNKNIFRWFVLFAKFFNFIFNPFVKYPDYLILEMGVDKPGDMDYLLSVVKPDLTIITAVGQTHLKSFGTVDNVLNEKVKLAKAVSSRGFIVANQDSKILSDYLKSNDYKFVSYSLSDKSSDVYADNIEFFINRPENSAGEGVLGGVKFSIFYKGEEFLVSIKNTLSYGVVYSALASFVVGVQLGLGYSDILKGLNDLNSINKNRMFLKKFVNDSFLIDDSYNASPDAFEMAVDVVDNIEWGHRKVVIAGDMLDLGDISFESHSHIYDVLTNSFDLVVLVGDCFEEVYLKNSVDKNSNVDVVFFEKDDYDAITKYLKDNICEKDLVLLKASRGLKFEKILDRLA